LRLSNPLIRKIIEINTTGRIALCGYFLAGFKSPRTFYTHVRACENLDIIEFGIPSCKPHLDGPIIAEAHEHVYSNLGIDAETSLSLIGGLRDIHQPRFVMTYTREARELDGFLKLCLQNSIHGILAPDVSIDEASRVAFIASSLHLAYIGFIDTSMNTELITKTILLCDIVYLKVSAGCTGAKGTFDNSTLECIAKYIGKIRSIKQNIIIAAGIGIQTPSDIEQLAALDINMVIIGTSLVKRVYEGTETVSTFVDSLIDSTKRCTVTAY
jgi:tryptophan synthase alpha subunit